MEVVLSNEILCILAAQGALKQMEVKKDEKSVKGQKLARC